MTKRVLLLALLLSAVGGAISAQEHAPAPAATAAAPAQDHAEPAARKPKGPADILLPHLTDSKHFEYPCFHSWEEWACHVTLPTWGPFHIGSFEIQDLGPTKHSMWLLISAIVVATLLLFTARAHKRHSHAAGHPKGFAAGLEAVILYLRNEIYLPVLGGHGGEKYVPFCLSLFFFIATCNVFGMIPYGSTATGNLAVTATLAIITFFMIEIAGMKALGKGYIGTIIYWPHDMSLGLKLPLTLIMTPIEIISKFTKPFALTVRLFANMVAGHVIILSLIGLIFLFGGWVALGAVPMALFIMVLETLVVFVQAFIFSLLAAVFIGQIRAAHH
jgi:F-type H+-transporting ATPase subunit a